MEKSLYAGSATDTDTQNNMTLEQCREIARNRRSKSENTCEFMFYDFIMQCMDTLIEINKTMGDFS